MAVKCKYPAVMVIWDDAESDVNWTEVPTTQLEPCHVVTIGFLVAESSDYYLVADSYIQKTSSKGISNTTKIPKKWVKEFHHINITRKKNATSPVVCPPEAGH